MKTITVHVIKLIIRQLNSAHGHLMPQQQHLYNRLAHPADYSTFTKQLNLYLNFSYNQVSTSF